MPAPEVYETLALGQLYISTDALRASIAAWTAYLQSLRDRSPMLKVKLDIYLIQPYWGGSFIDWDRPGGTIHISPYLWDRAAKDCPGYDLPWLSDTPSEVYDAYVGTLDWLNQHVPDTLTKAHMPPSMGKT